MVISESVKKQFVEHIMLQVFDDQYIDRQEEKSILEEGIKKGISVAEGISIIRQVASEKNLVIERDVEDRATNVLEQFALNDGVIDQKEFGHALTLFRTSCKGRVPEPELKKRLKQIILSHGWKVKEGGFFGSKWFTAIS
ncbi:MAG: hypothetical protein DRQ49_08845 [Gammaproteobacteria bacterium]|nr:MAG: hypothetical protein DRQ49_08845 [Gammaproteobacteria bacterium]RKZ45259.1 MAG: hypothetical protein DRQ41_00670 [Gammaproteobacteria bacterium]RKZ77388.1 MAG: hypothetical protein DRQ57_00065 [Gammaproteobacteria bacterium]